MNNTAIFDGTADKWESLYDRCSMQTSHSLETCYWLFLAVSCPLNCIKINDSYPGTFVSAPDPG